MYKVMLILLLAYSWIHPAQAATEPVDKYCYMLSENPQNHSFCAQTYKYDSSVVYFSDFNGRDIKATVKRQFRKSAPSVFINAQYDFETQCSSSGCDIQATSDNVLLAFQQAVRTNGFYTLSLDDVQPCIPGTICSKPLRVDPSIQQTQAAAKPKQKTPSDSSKSVTSTVKDVVDIAKGVLDIYTAISSDGKEVKIIIMTNQGKLVGTCILDKNKCESGLTVKSDSSDAHHSINRFPATQLGRQMDNNLDEWIANYRPRLICTKITKTEIVNSVQVSTTSRTCAIY